MNRFCAFAATAVLAGTPHIRANADSSQTSSATSCNFDQQRDLSDFSSEQQAAIRALFTKLCTESGGTLVNGVSPRGIPNLISPAELTGLPPEDYIPPEELARGHFGTGVYVAYVVEIDGHVSSATVITSSGNVMFDQAAKEFVSNVRFKSPGYLGSVPVRMYSLMQVSLHL